MKRFLLCNNKKIVRATALVMAALLMATFPLGDNALSKKLSVYADTKDDLEAEEAKLSETLAELDALQEKAERTDADLKETSRILQELLDAQAALEVEIEELQGEIDQNNLDLAEAQATLDAEYDSMKLRIQFMYENNSSDSVITAILTSGSLADILNRLEYISQVHQADRDLMTRYENALNRVEEIGIELASNMSDLMVKQAEYRDQQAAVETSLALLQEKADEYADLIASAKGRKATAEANISALEAKIREEEANAAREDPDEYEGGGSGDGGLGDDDSLTDDDNDPGFTGSVTGDELVAFALQFVGNPYVWGGNSLTNGCDCSGFVHLIYANFGYSTPRYSQAFKTVGQAVSFNNIKAGDIVVYPGHVAIYIGNGCIVEAQSTNAGITCNRSVTCHTITAIRRLL